MVARGATPGPTAAGRKGNLNVNVLSSFDFGNAWRVAAQNNTGATQNVQSIAKCLSTQPEGGLTTAKRGARSTNGRARGK